jgi:preprotein translocase subunit SecA
MSFFSRYILRGKGGRRLGRYERKLAAINSLEPSLQSLSDRALADRVRALRSRALGGVASDELVVEAFALGREAGRRTLQMRHFDVQLLGAMALRDGLIVEMKTGEGKTLVATLAAFTEALAGKGVHVVTVNDYLAQRDAEWMGPMYELLGLSVGVVLEQMGGDREEEIAARRHAYACDITYGTNHEIAFDYLRDNLALEPAEVVQRGHHYAIVDEVDFLLIDEARTPLIISGPTRQDASLFEQVDRVTRELKPELHFKVEAKHRRASLTEAGFEVVHQALGVDHLARYEHLDLYHAVHQSVVAHGVYQRDVDYIVEDGSVYIVDEFTGRVSQEKRFADGLHQALEAKERLEVRTEDQTLAKVTYQTFFGRYDKLSGMTGTAWSEREEFRQTYGRDVQVIPTHRPMIRQDFADHVFASLEEKHAAIVQEIDELRSDGRPVLVGSTSVRESEQLSARLKSADVPHAVLNAKNHRAEAEVVAQAGRPGAVTISTNMAGRGTDIVLGGRPTADVDAKACSALHAQVVAAGGLHVIGTSRHEAVRIDDQLRGRAGRQGDPGSSQFFISLDDPIWQRFGDEAIAELKGDLEAAHHPKGEPIGSGRVRRLLKTLQSKVDEENRAVRRDVLKYDLVVHAQREAIYGWRRTLVIGEGFDPEQLIRDLIDELTDRHPDYEQLQTAFEAHFGAPLAIPEEDRGDIPGRSLDQALARMQQRGGELGSQAFVEFGRLILLQAIDELWTDHLSNLERVEQGIGLRGYAQVDPLIEWRREAALMWQELLWAIHSRAVSDWFALEVHSAA